MSLGFNSKVQLEGGVYHVQTEDRGLVHPFIDTLVLFQGQILHRCSRDYRDLLASGTVDQVKLRARVEQQHIELLEALRGGSLSLETPAPTEGRALAIKLCNPGSWLIGGKASLDIEVRIRRDSGSCEGADLDVSVQGAGAESEIFSGRTDADGRALICFSLPEIAKAEDATLIIRALLGRMQDQIRYRVKPRSLGPGFPRE